MEFETCRGGGFGHGAGIEREFGVWHSTLAWALEKELPLTAPSGLTLDNRRECTGPLWLDAWELRLRFSSSRPHCCLDQPQPPHLSASINGVTPVYFSKSFPFTNILSFRYSGCDGQTPAATSPAAVPPRPSRHPHHHRRLPPPLPNPHALRPSPATRSPSTTSHWL
jgi:hypothetical protein